jgi:hypothetical protein
MAGAFQQWLVNLTGPLSRQQSGTKCNAQQVLRYIPAYFKFLKTQRGKLAVGAVA